MSNATLGFTIRLSGKNDRRVTFVASTAEPDSHGTRLHPRGCKYDAFMRNPTLLWNHATSRDNCEPDDVIGRVLSLSVNDDAVIAEVEFEGPENQKADRIYQKVLKGWIKAVSVGMITLEESQPDKDGIVDVLAWELRELSVVPVGSNGSALKVRGLGFSVAAPQPRKLNVATVLVRRQTDRAQLWGRRNDDGLYVTPGGKFADNELPLDAVVRELAEEADLRAPIEMYKKLGVVDMGRVVVHCYTVEVRDDAVASGAHDPDKEVTTWEWLQSAPPPEQMHARPNALERWLPARTSMSANDQKQTRTRSVKMSPEDVLAKLGLTADAAPADYAPALVKYLAGTDADADKVALVNALLSMLAPPAAADGDARAAAMRATTEEMRRLQVRNAELEDAAVKPRETPEQRADAAIRDGRWPLSQRAALVSQFAAGKTPHLHDAKTFTNRGLQFTVGGAAVTSATDAQRATPNMGNDAGATPTLSRADARQLALLNQRGIKTTPEQFLAAKANS